MRIKGAIEERINNGGKVFIAYVVAGDPSFDETLDTLFKLEESGVDIVELGVPYSDPAADGEANQESGHRALSRGVTLKSIIDFVGELRSSNFTLPIMLFTYLNPVLTLGYRKFASLAEKNGVDAALIVDLPPENASEYLSEMRAHSVGTVFLASPTTSKQRLKLIDKSSSEFVYYVARKGITGNEGELPDGLSSEIQSVKNNLRNYLCVGFGITSPKQVEELSRNADGIVVGSAFVRIILLQVAREIKLKKISKLACSLIAAFNKGEGKVRGQDVRK